MRAELHKNVNETISIIYSVEPHKSDEDAIFKATVCVQDRPLKYIIHRVIKFGHQYDYEFISIYVNAEIRQLLRNCFGPEVELADRTVFINDQGADSSAQIRAAFFASAKFNEMFDGKDWIIFYDEIIDLCRESTVE